MAQNKFLQEVTLRKNNSDERIGLTVSYSSGNGSGSGSDDTEACTEVYISDIMVDSVAARDGRLRQGDQILQVCSFYSFFIKLQNLILLIESQSRKISVILNPSKMSYERFNVGLI